MKGLGLEHSHGSCLGHDLHHSRRSAIAPLFAKTKIGYMQTVVQERVDALLGRLRQFQGSGGIFDIRIAYAALAAGEHKITQPKYPLKLILNMKTSQRATALVNQEISSTL